MILFNWKKIIQHSEGKSNNIFAILHLLTFKSIPKNTKDILYKYYHKDFSGDSFLIHPEMMFTERRSHKSLEWLHYIHLASFRNLNNYLETKDATLDLLHSPVKEEIIKNNSLLNIEDGRIHFLFEKPQGEK